MDKKYNKFLVFGNHPKLSLAELLSITDISEAKFFNDSVLAVNFSLDVISESFIDKLGGTIKMGEVLKISPLNEKKSALDFIENTIISSAKNSDSKFNFAFSDYSNNFLSDNFGLELKKKLKKANINSRLVVSKDKILSSVVVSQNKLIKKGIEIIIAQDSESILIGKTEAVQDFKDLSKRDYGRPSRDDYSGMLPPKLAISMLNLAGLANDNLVLLDPFCGSGTILTEAALLGYKKIIASDISSKAISDSKDNLEWIKDRYNLDPIDCRFINRSVLNLKKVIKDASVNLIVTEPYLGPQRALNNINLVKDNLEELYSQSLTVFEQILDKNGLVIMIWPVFFTNNFINPNYSNWEIVSPISDYWLGKLDIKLSKRKTLIYGRQGQKVWREIVILKRK